MALPASWTKVPVTAKYLAFDGTPIKGSVVFTPTRVVSVADSVVVPSAISVSIDAEGRIATDLPATNEDVRLEVANGATAEGQIRGRWVTNTDGWQ